jgi:ABC-2 type transport system permease protein
MSMPVNLRGILVVAEKNVRLYYTKPPVFIFGLLFPLFLFIAFFMGRKLDVSLFLPGFIAMTLFFTASSVGPLITPWERQAKTYERLLTYPVTIETVIAGDVVAGSMFGILITVLVVAATALILPVPLAHGLVFAVAIVLGGICFAALGSLLSSPATANPSSIMMLSSLVRFPLIFISGIFIPLYELQGLGRVISWCSPLTYLVDLINTGFGHASLFSPAVDVLVLLAVTVVFVLAARLLQQRAVASQ